MKEDLKNLTNLNEKFSLNFILIGIGYKGICLQISLNFSFKTKRYKHSFALYFSKFEKYYSMISYTKKQSYKNIF